MGPNSKSTRLGMPLPELRETGIPAGQPGRVTLPEHAVKALLTKYGIDIPVGRTFTTPDDADVAIRGLRYPLVLKAHGAGLIHKSEAGAVKLGLAHTEVPSAAAEMRAALLAQGIEPDGYLVEEQHPGGTELILGVVADATFGPVLLLGLGGVATEMLDLSTVCVLPLSRSDAEQLIDEFPGAPLLRGARGRRPVDRESLIELLLAIGGEDGLVSDLGPMLAEFECNPIVATETGVQALDARLLLDDVDKAVAPATATTDFSALFAPRAIAVAGASATRSTFGNRFLAAYRQIGWTDGLYALHPEAAEVDGVPAYPKLDEIPDAIDYLVVAVPATATADLAAAAAAAKVRFVHVITGGFAEMGPAGARLQADLASAINDAPTRILGPNCLGVFAPAGRQTFTLGAPATIGNVSVVSQSGGLSGDMITVGSQRGIAYSKLVSIGNAIDVTHGELVDWLVDDPETGIIGVYLEGTRDGASLLRALRRADRRKPVVILRGGTSRQGSVAVSSHTGSMASSSKVWDAVSEATGAFQVASFEQFISCLQYQQRYFETALPDNAAGVLVIGLGGGASVLATDACDRHGLTLEPLRQDLREKLRGQGYGAGTSVANPLEVPVGPASPTAILADAIASVFSTDGQYYRDVLVHVNAAAYYNYGAAGVSPLVDSLRAVRDLGLPARVAVVVRNAEILSAADTELISRSATDLEVPIYRDFDEAACAIASAQTFELRRFMSSDQ
ncbi:acetate--CoA ligase family protein [Nocardia sp. NPDC003963]